MRYESNRNIFRTDSETSLIEQDLIKVLRVDNHFHSENSPAIKTPTCEMWFLRGKLHRYRKPAIISGNTELYFWRGIRLSKKMAQSEMAQNEILEIKNIEQRQASIELFGYERFFSKSIEIDRWTHPQWIEKFPIKTNPMYILYEIPEPENDRKTYNQPVRILQMCDPSKTPIIKYAIRVQPAVNDCLTAVSLSYGIKNSEYLKFREWV